MLEKRRDVSKASTGKAIVFDNGDNRGQFFRRGVIANDQKEREREREREREKKGKRIDELGE